jgi:ribosomal protein S27E
MPCDSLHPRFDENEVHPLLLAPPPVDAGKLPTLFIPELESRPLRRLSLALWGKVFEEDLSEWRHRYGVLSVDGERALELKRPPAEILTALEPLVDLGLIRRGLDLRCPECNYRMVFTLAELDERLDCHACGRDFALPTRGPGGREEHHLVYRLDGLMARAMDQDLLPVLLALRTAAQRLSAPHFYAWPGVEFKGSGRAIDIDLLCSDGENVYCFEVKDNAASLKDSQLQRLLDLSAKLGARPALTCSPPSRAGHPQIDSLFAGSFDSARAIERGFARAFRPGNFLREGLDPSPGSGIGPWTTINKRFLY